MKRALFILCAAIILIPQFAEAYSFVLSPITQNRFRTLPSDPAYPGETFTNTWSVTPYGDSETLRIASTLETSRARDNAFSSSMSGSFMIQSDQPENYLSNVDVRFAWYYSLGTSAENYGSGYGITDPYTYKASSSLMGVFEGDGKFSDQKGFPAGSDLSGNLEFSYGEDYWNQTISLVSDKWYSFSLFTTADSEELDYWGDCDARATASMSWKILDTWEEPSATPIPGAVWLLGSGLVGLVGLRRKLKD